ncbi:MAG: 4-hydroxy-tetrahydrodipicolinate reductase [Alphaproteobacteria bacterium]|nr:4-hydroxy-tetrahydrodipicolinate reductase [Alphaproteobacteria bacterium]
MIRLAVVGATGRLGRRVVALAAEDADVTVVAAVARPGHAALGADVGGLAGCGPLGVAVAALGPGCLADAEVVVDVSLPEALPAVVPELKGRALVCGVTGGGAPHAALLDTAARTSPVLEVANFAMGVHVLADLVARAAAALPDYDVEIVEAHHRHKVDAPSGTARLLGQAVASARGQVLDDVVVHGRHGTTDARGPGIGMHALRLGDVVGEHTVWLAGTGERLLLGHVATSRDTFAAGALRCARWLCGRTPGRHDVRDVLGTSG